MSNLPVKGGCEAPIEHVSFAPLLQAALPKRVSFKLLCGTSELDCTRGQMPQTSSHAVLKPNLVLLDWETTFLGTC